jgi:hypothetical protein
MKPIHRTQTTHAASDNNTAPACLDTYYLSANCNLPTCPLASPVPDALGYKIQELGENLSPAYVEGHHFEQEDEEELVHVRPIMNQPGSLLGRGAEAFYLEVGGGGAYHRHGHGVGALQLCMPIAPTTSCRSMQRQGNRVDASVFM